MACRKIRLHPFVAHMSEIQLTANNRIGALVDCSFSSSGALGQQPCSIPRNLNGA
jgi:hypothetical protein